MLTHLQVLDILVREYTSISTRATHGLTTIFCRVNNYISEHTIRATHGQTKFYCGVDKVYFEHITKLKTYYTIHR